MTALDLIALARSGTVHFMGIGGAGMAPLAEFVQRSGGLVSGCDSSPGSAARALRERGIEVAEGHDPSHPAGCAALVITSAVPADHPEVLAARAAGVPVVKRAEALGSIVNGGTVIGISGTHGKTTTTALTTAVLAAAGLDPTALVGGRVQAWGGNLRPGGDRLFVVEADEYDRSFLTLHPSVAVVTTLEADHLDIYGSLEGVEEAFHAFVSATPDDGVVVGCADDSGVARLLARFAPARRTVTTYGLSAGSMVRADRVVCSGLETTFRVWDRGDELGTVTLRVPGLHNVRNALAAVTIARHLDVPWEAVTEGLGAYGGVERRFERIGEVRDVLVIDDYAHHPTEVQATLEAARVAYPGRRLVAVFQPHLYSRTRDFAAEFGRALALADLVFIADVYPAREQPIPGVTGELLVRPAREAGAEVEYLPARAEVSRAVVRRLEPGDVCLTLGAGNLDDAAREIVGLLDGLAAA